MTLREWIVSDPDPSLTGTREGCLLALAFCFLFWGAVAGAVLAHLWGWF
jgi:hypothetical protein